MTLAVAFLGGLVSCLSPCVIPVIPVFMSNVVRGTAVGATPAGTGAATAARVRAAGFLLGFAGLFVVLWVSLGLVGFALFEGAPVARPIAGLAIVGLGVATMAGWQPMVTAGRWGGAGSFGGSFLLGAGVAVGWTPCIGPTLGAILTLAAASPTVWAGAALLVAYAIGMAVPLVVIGLGLTRSPSDTGDHHPPSRVPGWIRLPDRCCRWSGRNQLVRSPGGSGSLAVLALQTA